MKVSVISSAAVFGNEYKNSEELSPFLYTRAPRKVTKRGYYKAVGLTALFAAAGMVIAILLKR